MDTRPLLLKPVYLGAKTLDHEKMDWPATGMGAYPLST